MCVCSCSPYSMCVCACSPYSMCVRVCACSPYSTCVCAHVVSTACSLWQRHAQCTCAVAIRHRPLSSSSCRAWCPNHLPLPISQREVGCPLSCLLHPPRIVGQRQHHVLHRQLAVVQLDLLLPRPLDKYLYCLTVCLLAGRGDDRLLMSLQEGG